MVGFSWFRTRSSIQVQAWPVHQTRPIRGVGLRRLGPWDPKTSSSHEVSRDSQRLRHWTPDQPVDVLLTKADRAPPRRSVSPLPIADSARSGSPSADRRLTSVLSVPPSVPGARSPPSPLQFYFFSFTSPFRPSLASKPTADSHTASPIQPIAPHRRSVSPPSSRHTLASKKPTAQLGALSFTTFSFWGAPLYEADKLLPSVSFPSLGYSPSQRTGRSQMSGTSEGRRRASRSTTTAQTNNSL